MGRPKAYTEPRVMVGVRLPAELHARVVRVARERNISMTQLVTEALSWYLQHLPPLEPN